MNTKQSDDPKVFGKESGTQHKFSIIAAATVMGNCLFTEFMAGQWVDMKEEEVHFPASEACPSIATECKAWLPHLHAL